MWDLIKIQVDSLNKFNRKNVAFIRAFYRGATELVPDSADRLLIPKRLLAWANVDKSVVLNAIDDRIEIWAEAEYEEMLRQEDDHDLSELAEQVLGGSSLPDLEGI